MKLWGSEQKTANRNLRFRSTVLFVLFIILFFINIVVLFSLSCRQDYKEAALNQSSYRMPVASVRGTIYDRNFVPLTNSECKTVAAVIPTPETLLEVTSKLGEDKASLFEEGTPFLLEVPDGVTIDGEGIDLFRVPVRDRDEAYHIIGYVDGNLNGVDGLEYSYNGLLDSFSGEAFIQYTVNAVYTVISPENRVVHNPTERYQGGVVTTLDKGLQNVLKTVLSQHVEKGSAIITEVSTGKILGIVSTPVYDKAHMEEALDREDAPLLNRALCSYEVGSVFKLVSAAAALESGVDEKETYFCQGSYSVDGMDFHCYDGLAHGKVDMKSAISESCNGYFIQCMQKVDPHFFLDTAYSFGFGTEHTLAAGLTSSAGSLPEEASLQIPRALANFSFGQGELTATPVQIAAMTRTIADDGKYMELQMIEGTVDENRNFISKSVKVEPQSVISAKTARFLRGCMGEAVESGTANSGKPDMLRAGAKTGTAQTGRFEDGEELVNHWYTGFYPLNNPQYTITVMAESVPSSQEFQCGFVFKEMADYLLKNGYIKN